ncbi:MBL fold metallo-hydrolase [Allostreptomyces psammosilenae]|uniref:L-ascorbate metabolism protein UlaG (Beta-lactamase superfamily) n=1 Tax=Allostreptomyces psammosilenae TaxID=1892865 RepID=A0A852ZLM2_9ACTN|nr:MBL fold metallo-hydrolase [Allostreptomyces psammosilenae]NYI03293.1 L-ascorbate metabolism protein UlaG (beta-lactamase superfamily) [Allostreptomyces psammosilenae]
MELTKFGHSCVRVTKEGAGVLVIDPGAFSEPEALDGADAVLITHEHVDHFDPRALHAAAERNPAMRVWTVRSVAEQLADLPVPVRVVGDQDTFEAAGFQVSGHGTEHAVIHPDIPRVANTGFLVDGTLFHPGDALTVPGVPVHTLLLPVHAPWAKLAEVIDYAREVAPQRAFALHDGLLNANGLAVTERLLGVGGPGIGVEHQRLRPGSTVNLR